MLLRYCDGFDSPLYGEGFEFNSLKFWLFMLFFFRKINKPLIHWNFGSIGSNFGVIGLKFLNKNWGNFEGEN
jgi:hypothetical protein